jgi:thiamine pyrophosphate-dependent acetolactate synthase large subunit-like protein
VTVADVIADGLRRAGVARVFVADGADATLVEAVRAAGLPVLEAAGAASACVMAAVTGRLGEAPGTAIIAGDDVTVSRVLARAMRDAAPMIVLAPRAPATAVAKAVPVAGADSAAHWIAHAAQAAMGDPRGGVWLVAASDVTPRAALPLATATRPPTAPIDPAEIDTITERVSAAARPLLVAGRGCRAPSTAVWVRAFAEALPAPVVATPAGRGALPEPHPLSFGVLAPGSAVVGRADLVITLGVDETELETGGVTFTAPVVRVGRVGPTLEELAARVRDRSRADWDVAELDRLRRVLRGPAVPPALAALVTRLREATPAETAAVFPDALEPASRLWQSVQPGDVLVEEDVLAASVAVALERPAGLVLAFMDAAAGAPAAVVRAGVRVVAPAPGAFAQAIDAALASSGPRVVVVAVPGEGGPPTGRV